MDRRQFLTATTVTGTTLLAGCGGSTDSSGTAADDGTPEIAPKRPSTERTAPPPAVSDCSSATDRPTSATSTRWT
ncbi:hypothetical protein ACFQER_09405 [Halomicroarcula sp. GCM10025894]|uniref:hypothetical protein n=1 Tax=Halomicroarcula sp. GCM10025894 TaxID=3252673 RepID=UPI0036159A52